MSTPFLFLVGATHRTAPFGFDENLALGPDEEKGLADELESQTEIREFVVLNTHDRVEIYGVGTDAAVREEVSRAFCSRKNVDPDDFGRFGFVLFGLDAVRHLLEVASGLDSRIFGETDILEQMTRAYGAALAGGTAGPVMNRLFQKAFELASLDNVYHHQLDARTFILWQQIQFQLRVPDSEDGGGASGSETAGRAARTSLLA